jgi:hypothetical protein
VNKLLELLKGCLESSKILDKSNHSQNDWYEETRGEYSEENKHPDSNLFLTFIVLFILGDTLFFVANSWFCFWRYRFLANLAMLMWQYSIAIL